MDVPVTFKIRERQHAAEEGDAAEDYKDPTDDRNREWPPFHWATRLHGSWTDVLTFSGFSSVEQRTAAECQ